MTSGRIIRGGANNYVVEVEVEMVMRKDRKTKKKSFILRRSGKEIGEGKKKSDQAR